jgi:type I restriction enzyme S subunit
MKRYPAYKDSGLSWLGEMPEHWKIKRLKFLAVINLTRNLSKITKASNEEVTFLPMENISAEGVIDNSIKRKISKLWEVSHTLNGTM